MAVFSVVINQNITMQKPIPTFKHPTVGSPAGHTLNWECPTLLEATPGAHHRGCLARDGWEGLDATGNFWHCQIQIWSLPHCCKFLNFCFKHCFSSLYFRSLLVILTAGCLTSKKAVWDQRALSSFGNPSHTPTDGAAPTLAGGTSRLFAMGRLSQNTMFL